MKDHTKPKILVISLGGTWSMQRGDQPSPDGVETACLSPELLGEGFSPTRDFYGITEFCIPSFWKLLSLDSSNLRHSHWQRLAEVIGKQAAFYDAFVVLQGTDTMAYVASAMAFALQGLGKPVIFTGAQLRRGVPGSDALTNIVNAIKVASLVERQPCGDRPALGEVAVVFGSRIIRATRCRKTSEDALEAFDSVNVPLLGRIGLEIRISPFIRLAHLQKHDTFGFQPASEFSKNVALLHVYPGMDPEFLTCVGRRSSAVVLAAFGAGNIPCGTDSERNPFGLQSALDVLYSAGIPVAITTQCNSGQADPGMYEAGEAARRAGAIICNDMSSETAFVKLSWLLANEDRWPAAAQAVRQQGQRLEAVRIAMMEDLAGEIGRNELYYPRETTAAGIRGSNIDSEAA